MIDISDNHHVHAPYDDSAIHKRVDNVSDEVHQIRTDVASLSSTLDGFIKGLDDRLSDMAGDMQGAKTPWLPIMSIVVTLIVAGALLNTHVMSLRSEVAVAKIEGARAVLQAEVDNVRETIHVLIDKDINGARPSRP